MYIVGGPKKNSPSFVSHKTLNKEIDEKSTSKT